MGVAPTQRSLPVTCIHQLALPVTSRAPLLPPVGPGPAQVTPVSRLCWIFLTPLLVTKWKSYFLFFFLFQSGSLLESTCVSHTFSRSSQNAPWLYSSPSQHTNPQKPSRARKNFYFSPLNCLLLLSVPFPPCTPALHKHIPHFPFLYFVLAHAHVFCWLLVRSMLLFDCPWMSISVSLKSQQPLFCADRKISAGTDRYFLIC